MTTTARTGYCAIFLLSLAMLGTSFALEHFWGLTPCPLCLIARYLVFCLTLLFGIAWLHNPGKRGRVAYLIFSTLLCLLGIAVTLRHLYIQHLPPELAPACTPGLDYLLETLPVLEAFLVVLHGSGECAKSSGALLGLSLPAWTLLGFIGLGVLNVWGVFGFKKKG